MQNDKFNELLRKRAKEFLVTPNANAFDNILARKKQQKQKRKRIFFFSAASCFLLVSVIALANYFYTKNTTILQDITEQNISEITTKNESQNLNKNDSKREVSTKITKLNKDQIQFNKRIENKNIYKSEISTEIYSGKPAYKQVLKEKDELVKPILEIPKNEFDLPEIKPLNTKEITINQTEKIEFLATQKDSTFKLLEENKITANKQVAAIDSLPKTKLDLSKNVSKKTSNLGFQLALFNNYMFLTKAYNGGNNEAIQNNFGINYNEQANRAYSLGFMTGVYRNKFTFSAGLAYNQIEFDKIYKIDPLQKSLVSKENFRNAAGYFINVIDQSLSFIEIPMSVAYKIGNKKWSVSTEIGTAIQFLTKTQTYTLQNDSLNLSPTTTNEVANNRFNKVQYLLFSSVHAQYQISKHVSFFAGPTVRVHFNQYFKNEFTNKPAAQYVGLSSGIKFIF
ncbi:MAG: hypothetical protein ACOYMA_10470 [Bacteroidia bacterium]